MKSERDYKYMYYHEYFEQLLKYSDKHPYKNRAINLVTSPCGSGKSYHCQQLINSYSGDKSIYYVTDTRMLRESVKNDLPEHVKIITYQTLGIILSDEQKRKQLFSDTTMIMLDEVHQLFRYAKRFNDDKNCDADKMFYKMAITWLYELPKYMRVLALSGTPGDLINHANNENESHMINKVLSDEVVARLNQQHVENKHQVLNMSEWLENEFYLPKGEQALGYTSMIDSLITYKTILESKGYKVGVLWSKNATGFTPKDIDRTFTDEQEQLYEYVRDNNEIPTEFDVLLVNSAYESGWNLENNSLSRVQTVFVNTSDNVTITQITNRVRHDIRLQVTSKPVPTRSDYFNREWVDDEYFKLRNVFIDTWEESHLVDKESKNNLCNNLSIINESRRLIKTYNPLTEYMERLYQHRAYNHFDDKSGYYLSFDNFIYEYGKYINRPFAIDLVTFYDENGKQHKNAWQIRNIVRGVNKGDKRSLFQKIQYLKAIGYGKKEVAEELDLELSRVSDNWNEQYKPQNNPNKYKSNKEKKADRRLQVQQLKEQGLKQKQVAEKLGIGIATVKRHWNK